jgi:hypothetical protein
MKIIRVDAMVLRNPRLDPDACDFAQEIILGVADTDDGICGVAEVDVTPEAVQA